MRSPQRSAPGLRAHRAKYDVNNEAVRAMKQTLRTLDEHDVSLIRAISDAAPGEWPGESLANVRNGLRLLVHGPTGEFK